MAVASPAPLDVVGAVIVRDGLVLCAQRGLGSQAGSWEFPGGKIEPDETAEQALRREIWEELGCLVEVGALIADSGPADHGCPLRLRTYWCAVVSGEPQPREHAALNWLTPGELARLKWAPADVATVRVLAN